MKKHLKLLLIDLLAVALGALLTLAFAPFEIFPFAIISMAGLLMLLSNISPKRARWRGFLFGLGLFGTGVYWVFISIHLYGDVPSSMAVLITAALIAVLALFPAYACYLTNRYFRAQTTAKLIFAFPAIWLLITEWMRSWIFGGFPWLLIGYSQTNSPLIGYAPLLSVYGVSLTVLLSAGLVVNGMNQLTHQKYKNAYLNLFALFTIWIAGVLLNLIPWTHATGNPIPVSLVQGNIPQALKWSPEHTQLSFDRYEQLTEPLWGKSKIIIWPEAALPMPLQNAEDFIAKMDDKARASKSTLILGIPIHDEAAKGYYNAVITVGEDSGVYTKRRLVPFGEYVPFQQISARFFDFMKIPISNLIPGSPSQKPLQVDHINIITAICFEVAFPDLMQYNDSTAGILLTVTNDAWFGKSTAQAQHLQMAAMRSIELGRPSLFVSNNGITAIINAQGKIQSMAPRYQIAVLNGMVQPYEGLTPWMKTGIDPILAILIMMLVAAALMSRQPNNKK